MTESTASKPQNGLQTPFRIVNPEEDRSHVRVSDRTGTYAFEGGRTFVNFALPRLNRYDRLAREHAQLIEKLRELVESTEKAHADFDHQFAVGLQVRGAARASAVEKQQMRYFEARGNARKLLHEVDHGH